jgi:hypothetical protein
MKGVRRESIILHKPTAPSARRLYVVIERSRSTPSFVKRVKVTIDPINLEISKTLNVGPEDYLPQATHRKGHMFFSARARA